MFDPSVHQGFNEASPASNPVNTKASTGRAFFRLAAQPVLPFDLNARGNFLDRLPLLETALEQGHTYFREVSASPVQFTTAAEWMLDNFILIQQSIHQVCEDFTQFV